MDRLERLKELPTTEEWIETLRIRKYEGTERINPYHVLIHQLEVFLKDQKYTRARDLWIMFYLYCLPPPKEVELVFLRRIASDANAWKRPKNKDADLGLLGREMKKGDLQRFDKRMKEIHKKLLLQGRKAWNGDVFNEMALERNEIRENETKKEATGGALLKEYGRLKKLVENMD